MSSYVENVKGKVDWMLPNQRTGKFPLDRSDLFSSYDDAVLYAKGDGTDSRQLGKTSYVGLIITVFENDVVTVFKINADRKLEPINGTILSKSEYEGLKGSGKLVDGMVYYTYED